MRFIDEAQIQVIAGDGGNGSSSMRREKFIPFGGPDGGDGAQGGSIYAIANRNINTLIDFHYLKKHLARKGGNGRGSCCYGKSGKDVILPVPIGTVITDIYTKEVIADLTKHNEKVVLVRGGSGGFGNLHFKSSTNRAPRQKTDGKPGERRTLFLELKLLADVGLVGMPNSGKSTFISSVSNAKPKIADYPFTTLVPNLGTSYVKQLNKSFIIADIPGLIRGAAEGVGLGYQFLRHLQRTRILLHLVDISSKEEGSDPVLQARTIVSELRKYNETLYEKPRWLVLNKIDAVQKDERFSRVLDFLKRFEWNGPVFEISALTGQGCKTLTHTVCEYLSLHSSTYNATETESLSDDVRFRNILYSI